MAFPRAFANAVVLPNGQVVVVGGQTVPDPFYDTDAVLIPEIWDPTSRLFRQLSPMQTPRNYHSTAILLQDGRVFVGGGGQCGESCTGNHFDAEILTPPYLLKSDGTPAPRPAITRMPVSASLGSVIRVSTDEPVVSFALIRLSAVTHSVNNDERRIPLAIKAVVRRSSYILAIPEDPGVVIPGNYMLFALDAQGVPSKAQVISLHQE
jgi:galactose oxidase